MLFLFRGQVLCRVIEVLPKSGSSLILPKGIEGKEYFDEHPYQFEVVHVGGDIELCGDGVVDKVVVGDILYLSRLPVHDEMLLFGGEVLVRVYQGNILCVVRKGVGG